MESNKRNIDKLEKDVAIIGIGMRFPHAGSPNEFYQNLLNRKDCIIECPQERMTDNFFKYHDIDNHGGYLDLEEWKSHDPIFFGSSIPDTINCEPQIRLLNKVAYETFENASVLNKIKGSDTSVYIGYHVIEYEDILGKNRKTMGSYNTLFSTIISHSFDLRGESSVCATACSSSFTAIQKGYENIIMGNSQMSLCGGVSSMISTDFREKSIGAYAITQTGRSHTFEENADGFCRGEGAGLVLLKKYSKAIQDGDKIYCVIKSMNTNNDGCFEKINRTQPSGAAQAENMKLALSKISMNPSEIYYIEPHGTGTPVGDPIEAKALSKVFKESHSSDNPLYLGSLKPNIGHLEAASGVSSLIKACLMMKHRKLLPMFKFEKPNPDIKFNKWNLKMVPTSGALDFPSNKTINIGINNFGIGGTNTFLILGEHQSNQFEQTPNTNIESLSTSKDIEYLIPFSSNSIQSLRNYQDKLVASIDNIKNDIKFVDFVKNQINKYHFVNRNVISAKDWEDLKSLKIKSSYESKLVSTLYTNATTPIVFVFTGQGAQFIGMAKELINQNKVFNDALIHCDSILSKYFGYSIYEKLTSLEELKDQQKREYLINEPILAQPAMFLIQYSLIELLKFYGITPSVVLGHSFGEITAAYSSGILSLEDTCKLIYYRAIPQNKTAGLGRMLSISIGQDDFKKRFSKCSYYNQIEIGCYNSNNSIVIVSTKDILELVKAQLTNDGIFTAYLSTDCPFHSSKQQIIKEEINSSLQFLEDSNLELKIPFYSTVTTNQWLSSDKFNSDYIYDNIAKPVYFYQTLKNLMNNQDIIPNGKAIFVEISPHSTLSYYIKTIFDQESAKSVVCPLNKKKSDIQQFNESISTIFCNGGNVDFSKQSTQLENNHDNTYKFVNDYMPHYQWDNLECWIECNEHYQKRVEGPAVNLLGLKKDCGQRIYEALIDVNKVSFSFLKDHVIGKEIIFPGCGYLSTVLNLYINNGKDITIPYFNCLVPFIIDQESTYTLQLVITNLSKTDDKFQFFKKENKKDCAWVEVSNGKISTLQHKNIERKKPIEQFLNRCHMTTLLKDDLYLFIKEKFKLVFGPNFVKIDKVYLGNKIAVAESESFKTKESIFDTSFLNTTILDSMFHCGFVLDLDNDIRKIYLDRIEDLRLFTNNIPKSRDSVNKLYSVGETISRKGKSLKIKIQVFLEDGTQLYEITSIFTTSKIIKDKIRIQDHQNKYSFNWQLKNSPLPYPTDNQLSCELPFTGYDNPSASSNIAACFYYKFIQLINSDITLQTIENSLNEELIEKYLSTESKSSIVQKRIFIKVMNQIKNNKQLIVENYPEEEYFNYLSQHYSNPYFLYPFLSKGSLFQICQLFNKDPDQLIHQIKTPVLDDNIEEKDRDFFTSFLNIKSKFEFLENPQLKDFIYKQFPKYINSTLCDTVSKIIKANLNQKYIFKIVEFGGGSCGLSFVFLKTIYDILESNPDHQITVHYTYSDISSAFIPEAVSQLNQFSNYIKISYKTFDLDKPLIKQGLNQSSYDLAIMQFVLHAVKDLEYSLNQIYQILNPKGYLLFEECSKNDVTIDSFFANFSQWCSYEDKIRTDHCCLNINEWYDVLTRVGFNKNIQFSKEFNDNSAAPFIINAQKPNIDQLEPFKKYNQIIVYCSDNQNQNNNNHQFIQELYQHYSSISNSITNIHSFDQLVNYVSTQQKKEEEGSSNNLIIYVKGLESLLNESNFEYYNYELTQISKYITTAGSSSNSYQLLLLTHLSQIESTNYYSSSLIGIIKYFFLYPQFKLFSIDIDDDAITNSKSTFNKIQVLLNDFNFVERIFSIRNGEIKVEKVYQESNRQIISNSYENESVKCILNNELSYEIHPRPLELGEHQIEIENKANSVNFKDQLIYTKVLKSKSLCPEFSGIVTRIGSKVKNFKVGDKVYSVKKNVLGSHSIVEDYKCCLMPSRLSFEEAASVVSIFITSYFSLYKTTKVKNGMTLLIHSATSGVGLATLNLLKFKQFKGTIFATVGSEDKEKYLKDVYGDFINAIYSTRNSEFYYEIKEYLSQINNGDNNSRDGVDYILNTLPGEFMSTNASLLKPGGSIVDLSVTHIAKNDLLDFSSMGFHYNYHQVELSKDWKMVFHCLRKITKYIETGLLELPPLSIYNINDIKTVFEKIQSRKHIGKFVVNYGDREMINKEIEDHKYKNTIVKSNYSIDENIGETILITGQRGLALHFIKWVSKFSKSVKDIIVFSKSKLHWELEFIINYYKSIDSNIRIHYRAVDVGNKNELKNAIDQIYSDFKDIKPVESIFHCAFELSDSKITDIKLNNFKQAHYAKSHGSINLHNLSIEYKWNLKNFILNSSLVTIIGSESQLAYTVSNYLVEGLTRYRKSLGLPAIVIKWGALDNSYVTRNDVYISHIDYMLTVSKILGSLDLIIQPQNNNKYTELTFSKSIPKLSNIDALYSNQFDHFSEKETKLFLHSDDFSVEHLIEKISSLLQIEKDKLNLSLKLIDYGADSLIIIHLKNFIEKNFVPITQDRLQSSSIKSVIDYINSSAN